MGAPTMYYFGCKREAGHYFWDESGQSRPWHSTRDKQPWGNSIDTGLCYPKDKRQGIAKHTVAHGWSALAWWDNSVDSRPGSHSTFIAEGTHSAEEMLAMARARFPWVFTRFRYDVVLPLDPQGGGK